MKWSFILLLALGSTAVEAQVYSVEVLSLGGNSTRVEGRRSINSRGHVIGVGDLPGSGARTVFFFDGSRIIPLSGYGVIGATALDDQDQVFGFAHDGPTRTPFLWTSSGGFQVVAPPFSMPFGGAFEINLAGTAAGNDGSGGFAWTRESGVVRISAPCCSNATLVNDAGQVAGTYSFQGSGGVFLWDRSTGVTTIPVGRRSSILDLTDEGAVLITSTDFRGREASLSIWSPARGVLHPGLFSLFGGFGGSQLNAVGQVSGTIQDNFGTRGFLWSAQDGYQQLTLEGFSQSAALAMNDSGQIVGWAANSGARVVPFVYRRGVVEELDSLLPLSFADTINRAYAITDMGIIAAETTDHQLAILTPKWFRFAGFHPPIKHAPIENRAQAGSAIPVRFGLGGSEGYEVFAAGYPMSAPVDCAELETDFLKKVASVKGNAPRHAYAWKTERAWAGTCRALILRFADGSERRALFRFR